MDRRIQFCGFSLNDQIYVAMDNLVVLVSQKFGSIATEGRGSKRQYLKGGNLNMPYERYDTP